MSTETHGQRIVRESELSVIDTGYDDCTPEVAADLARRIDAAVSEAGLSHLCSELQDEVEAYVERLDKYDAALNAERAEAEKERDLADSLASMLRLILADHVAECGECSACELLKEYDETRP